MGELVDAGRSSKWDAVAKEYEARVEPFTRLFVHDMLSRLDVGNNHSLLDVGCGTGALALIAAEKYNVTACDNSEAMVQRLKQRIAPPIGSIDSFVSDGQNLPVNLSNKFDYVASCFAVIFFPNPVLGLGEMLRCLKPRTGRVVISAWGDSAETPAFQVIPDAIQELLPELAKQSKPNRVVGSPETLRNLLTQAGFVDVEVVGPVARLLCVDSGDAYFNRFALTSPPLHNMLSELSFEQHRSLKRRIVELARDRSLANDGSIRLSSSAYVAYGRRP